MSFHSSHLPKRGLLGMSLVVSLSFSSQFVVAEEVEVLAEVAKPLALDGQAGDAFGYSVSLDSDRLAVGAYLDGDNGKRSGSAYVFERDATGIWTQASKLLALDGQSGDTFGHSVALDGDRLAVGADGDNDNGTDSGAAYVFEREAAGSWTQVIKLLALDGQAGDRFGYSVSLEGDRLVVGADQDDDNGTDSGSAYVFERDAAGSWTLVSKVLALDGQSGDHFGYSVSLDGDRLAIGAEQDDDNGDDSGSVYVFEREASGSWTQVNKLLALDGQDKDVFGRSVSLDGDRLAVGASQDDDNGLSSGSAYIFERDVVGSWMQVNKLLALDGQENDFFGRSVSLDGDRLTLGAERDDDNGDRSGSAYVFLREVSGSWTQVDKLLALDGQGADFFGQSVSLDGERVAVGAHGGDDGGTGSGSVYVFEPVLVSPHLAISGTCPGEIQLTSTGTTPRSRFGIYGSPNQGIWEFGSSPCEGTVLGLDAPASLRQTSSDFDAEGSLARTVDAAWCGTYLQLLDERTCLTSNVIQIP